MSVNQSVNNGDIVGVFFNVNNLFPIAPNNFTASLVDVNPNAGTASGLPSTFIFDNDGTTNDNDLDSNVNLNGGPPAERRSFDFGVQIGTGGANAGGAADFFSTVVFDIQPLGLTVNQFANQSFGARLQSVGINAGGSSKLGEESPTPTPTPTPTPQPVPEPGTILGLALISGALKVLRDRKQR